MNPNSGRKTESIAVLGGGYVGGALVRRALEKGMRVSALTRNPATAAALNRMGAVNVVCTDLESEAWHDRITPRQDIVVNCVGSGGGGVEGYRRSYVRGQESINRWLSRGGASILLYTGSTGVYPQDDGSVVDETCPAGGHSEYADVLLEAERKVIEDAGRAELRYVLRLAGIYGPARHYMLDRVLSEAGTIRGNGEDIMNAVHLDDVCGAAWAVIEGSEAGTGGIYNVVDDCPAKRSEVAGWLAMKTGRRVPRFDVEAEGFRPGRRRARNRRISNEKLKQVFSWRPVFPTFREGYERILKRAVP